MRRDLSTWLGTLGMIGRKAKYRRGRQGRSLKSRGASSSASISLGGGEPLDPRKMLAVTANLVGTGLTISLSDNGDVAGLVYNTGTSKYDVYDNTTLVNSYAGSSVDTIEVIDTKGGGGTGQVFEIRDGGSIAAAVGVSAQVETTKIFDDINVTSKATITGVYGVVISSPTILLDDATPANALLIATNKTKIEFGGVVTIIDDSQVQVGTGAGAGNIDFKGNIEGGGEDGSGTLSLTAGTGVISFSGTVGGSEAGYELHGVEIKSAASVSAGGKLYLVDSLGDTFTDGLTIGDKVNNADFSKGGKITGFTVDGAGIWFQGASTGSTVKDFELTNNTYGIYLGGAAAGVADLSGTVIDDNDIKLNDFGIYLEGVSGELGGEDALVIGGTVGNLIHTNGEDGIYGDSSVGVEISKNTIWQNGIDGAGAGSGIKLVNGGDYLIKDNTIGEDLVLRGPGFGGNSYDGITVEGTAGEDSYAGTVIRDNTIQNNGSYGVRVTGVTLDSGEDSLLIFSNDIVSNGAFDTTLGEDGPFGGIEINNSTGIRIIGNNVSFNGEDSADGIDIVNGSHGTQVYSNTILGNSWDGIYVADSSTFLNPVQIGDVLPVSESTSTTVSIEGDLRAQILVGQFVGLGYIVDPTDIKTATLVDAEVLSVSYDSVADETTLTFASVSVVPRGPFAVTLGNFISGNGEDNPTGDGINVYASGEGVNGTVSGLEILGNIVVSNAADGIHLEGASSDGEDLTQILVAGNFVGYNPLPFRAPVADGNGENGIYLANGSYVSILQNYVANNGDPNPSVGDDENGIEIVSSNNVDIGEDGLGNYIYNNADDGIDIKGSRFISVVSNEIASNGDDGIDIEAYEGTPSQDILIENNWIYDNPSNGIEIDDAYRVRIDNNLIENNGNNGVRVRDGEDVYVGFSIIRGQDNDGVSFVRTTGAIEGNEIYDNGGDGVYVYGDGFGEDSFRGPVDVLGNIIRENGNNGVVFEYGRFYAEDSDLADRPEFFSLVGGNTIERNANDGVKLNSAAGVQVGGRSPSEINFINLNGASGVCVSGQSLAFVLGNEIDSNAEYGVCLENIGDLDNRYPSGVLVGASLISVNSLGDGIRWGAGPDAVNTIRRNGIAGVFATGESNALVVNNEISENPIGVMITSATGLRVGTADFPGEDGDTFGNHIFDNGEGIRATGDSYGTVVEGNLIEDNLTGATLASVRGLTFGGEDFGSSSPYGNTVQNNKEGLRASGDLTETVVAGNEFLDNTKVGIALQSAKNLTVGGFGEDAVNLISGSPIGLSASGTMTGTEVVGNEFDSNTVGISLSKARGMTVGGNTIANSLRYGISVTGNNADTLVVENTITNTGDGPYAGVGIYLSNARNVDVIGNDVDGSSLAGLYATGDTSGTVVQGNLFTDNRIGMFLENATNAVFGGLGEDEGNTIIGGGDPLSGEYRDGISVVGTSTGSSITGTDVINTATGVWLRDAQGIEIRDTFVDGAKFFGLRASGDLTGSKFHDNLITGTTGIGGGLGDAMYLDNAKNLQVYDNIGEDSFGAGIYVTGDTSGTSVTKNLLDGNRDGISLFNATNAVIGGVSPNGNTVVGGSNAASEVYRDGIKVVGTSTGSSITGTSMSDVTTGVTLENATGIIVESTTITGAEFLGVNAAGTLTGSQFRNNTVTSSGGLGFLGHGIYLANASGLAITGNDVTDNKGNGLNVEGITTNTTVYDNDFNGNRVGIYLLNATNAVIGGDASGEDNRIVGGGDASKGDFRDGIVASGTLTGSSITQTSITNAATGITLSAATGLVITSATVTGSQVWGLNANGLLTGTEVNTSTFSGTTDGAGGGAGVLLAAARSLLIDEATIENNVVGVLANGDCTGTSVIDTKSWSGNGANVISTATGLVITPPAP